MQVKHGGEQLLHVLSEESPHCPDGQAILQVFKLKKLGEEQLVQKEVMSVQVKQGEVHVTILHVRSFISPTVPFGQDSTHFWELKKKGAEQLRHVSDESPEHLLQGAMQALHIISKESP